MSRPRINYHAPFSTPSSSVPFFFFFFFPLFDRVESETRSQGYRDEKQKRENTWKLTLINFVGLAPINEGEPLDPSPRTD